MTTLSSQPRQTESTPRRRVYVPVVGPRLKWLLTIVFALFALLAVNSVYLSTVTFAQWATGQILENYFYQFMFLAHLALGLAIVLPVVLFGAFHIRNAHNRPNRRAVRAGYALFTISLAILITGLLLTRSFVDLKHPAVRSALYWLHVITPVLAVWLFVLHRLAGRRIKWKVGLGWAGVAAAFAVGMLAMHSLDPRQTLGNPEGDKYFFPSLARTTTGDFIPASVLQNDDYCRECHPDTHDSWLHSMHKFSSFNNPPYLFSVRETRQVALQRDGKINASRWCAGCHDPVPFFSGRFNDPQYDDVNDPTAHAGVTCTVCHSITHVGQTNDGVATTLGNADYVIAEPIHYPFTFSDNPVLKWVNRQLIKAKPGFHKAMFLKPEVHRSTEFCGTCHKVHLPPELNDYKWLRGQNHYDAFNLSGVSGRGITSFYYPPQAEVNCNDCHMPHMASNDFGAKPYHGDRDESLIGKLTVRDHQFPGANTGVPALVDMPRPQEAIARHREFLEGVMRVDIFGVREEGRIDGELTAPVRPEVPALTPGRAYLLDTVIRTVKMGHIFTQGTADSNEIWLDVTVTSGDRVIGRSGGLDPVDRSVDPWSHFVNVFMLDRDGNRINRRNPQNIFTPLYNNQIPPGAADVVHYLLRLPEDVTEPVTVEVKLQYRKFDTEYMGLVTDDADYVNDLPITTLAHDTVTFPIDSTGSGEAELTMLAEVRNDPSPIPEWQRWNDYGIGLLLAGEKGELRQAAEAFSRVEELGKWHGPLNLARVYLKEGLVTHNAPEALRRTRDLVDADNGSRVWEWSLLWFTALVDKQNGNLDAAIRNLEQIVEGGFEQAVGRGYNFAADYRLLNELAETYYLRALQERGETRRAAREELMRQAERWYARALAYDTENVTAHYGLQQVYADLGEHEKADHHGALHAKYKPDDNARDRAIALARQKYPAANHAAEDVVIYDLQRAGAPGLPGSGHEPTEVARRDD